MDVGRIWLAIMRLLSRQTMLYEEIVINISDYEIVRRSYSVRMKMKKKKLSRYDLKEIYQ